MINIHHWIIDGLVFNVNTFNDCILGTKIESCIYFIDIHFYFDEDNQFPIVFVCIHLMVKCVNQTLLILYCNRIYGKSNLKNFEKKQADRQTGKANLKDEQVRTRKEYTIIYIKLKLKFRYPQCCIYFLIGCKDWNTI